MSMGAAATPRSVGPNPEGTLLVVSWGDGHVSEFAPWSLRAACPCAGCVDEMTGRQILQPVDVDPGVYPLEISYVGRYALRFDWSDGHNTGIYPFEYLRRICPCGECTGA